MEKINSTSQMLLESPYINITVNNICEFNRFGMLDKRSDEYSSHKKNSSRFHLHLQTFYFECNMLAKNAYPVFRETTVKFYYLSNSLT